MKSGIRIVSKEDAGYDTEYWASKTPLERLAALEKLRAQQTIINGTSKRLQRVLRITKRQ
ncbi:MAG: hypothetical protein RJQ09_07995 [Cyclobacteriaceae bacterium]